MKIFYGNKKSVDKALARAQRNKNYILNFKVLLFAIAILLFGLSSQGLQAAENWCSEQEYFDWFGDSPTNTPSSYSQPGSAPYYANGVTAGDMLGGSGLSLSYVQNGGATVFRSSNVNSNYYDSTDGWPGNQNNMALYLNEYIYATITVPSGNNKIRLSKTQLNYISPQYYLSVSVCDVTGGATCDYSSPPTKLFEEKLISSGTPTFSAGTDFTAYEMLPGRTYQVRWYMDNGACFILCTGANLTFDIDNPRLFFQASVSNPVVGTITQPTCAVPTGSVVLSGLSASGTWTITRSPGGTTYSGSGTSTTITGLPAGASYTFTVTNPYSCTSPSSSSVTINAAPTAPSAPTASVTVQPTCAVSTGTIVVSSPAQGTGYEYSIGGAYQASATFTGVTAGTKSVTVRRTSDNTCISSGTSVTVNAVPTVPATPTASVTVQPTCAVPTGTIVVTAPTGATYEYQLDAGTYQSSATFTGVSVGSHTVKARLAASPTCISSASTSMTVNAVPIVPSTPTASVTVQPTCAVTTGTIVVTAPTGATYEYQLDAGTYQSSVTFTGASVGSHTVKARLAASPTCISSASASMTVNAQPSTPSAPTIGTVTQPACPVTTGSVALSGLPASGTWTVTASPGGATKTSTGTTTTFTGLSAGTYSFTVTNADGCTSSSSSGSAVIIACPNISIAKSSDKKVTGAAPGDVITYTVQAKNDGTGTANTVIMTDSLGSYNALSISAYSGTPFNLTEGSPVSGLTLGTPTYSSDGGATYTYSLVSGAGGAPAGYDGVVTNWKIIMNSTMNGGGANFTLNYKAIVK